MLRYLKIWHTVSDGLRQGYACGSRYAHYPLSAWLPSAPDESNIPIRAYHTVRLSRGVVFEVQSQSACITFVDCDKTLAKVCDLFGHLSATRKPRRNG